MQTWRPRSVSITNSRCPGWQAVSSRSAKNISLTGPPGDCGLAAATLSVLGATVPGPPPAPGLPEENTLESAESGLNHVQFCEPEAVWSLPEVPELAAAG